MSNLKAEPVLRLGSKTASNDSPTIFIADLAANHDGSLDRAKELIRLAAQAGADVVKFQHFRASEIVSDHGFRQLGSKLDHQAAWKKTVFEVYEDASLPWSWTVDLKAEAEEYGVEFMTSPYDFEAVDHVDPFVNAYKIGSGDITWLEIVDYIASKHKPVILATGASHIAEIESAAEVIRARKVPFCLMQCNTNYTGSKTNVSHVNLKVLDDYKTRFPDALLGLSDHTHGDVTVLGAIALGARVIEKHFTDSNDRVGPDHGFSMTPDSWAMMVTRTRELESALGSGLKKIEANEQQAAIVQRRSIRFKRDLREGDTIAREDLSVLRPAPDGAIGADALSHVVGRVLRTNVSKDEAVSFEQLA